MWGEGSQPVSLVFLICHSGRPDHRFSKGPLGSPVRYFSPDISDRVVFGYTRGITNYSEVFRVYSIRFLRVCSMLAQIGTTADTAFIHFHLFLNKDVNRISHAKQRCFDNVSLDREELKQHVLLCLKY